MALFGKGGVSMTPAQEQFQKLANQQMQQSLAVWQPIQQQFAQRLETNRAPLQEQARAAGAGVAQQKELATQQHNLLGLGSQASSGRGLTAIGDTANAGAGAASAGLIQGQTEADKAYLGGLGQVVANGMNTQEAAMQGLQSAANAQNREQQANVAAKGAFWSGVGKLAGLGVQAGVGAL